MSDSKHYPSLFLITSGHEAKWFEVTDTNKAKLIESHITAKSSYEDKEGHFKVGRGGKTLRSAEPDLSDHLREQDLREHIKSVSQVQKRLVSGKDYKHLSLAAPDYLKEKFIKELGGNLEYVSGNHVNANHKQMLNIFQQSLKP